MKKNVIGAAAVAVALVTAAPAAADELYAVTPSGRTEATFDLAPDGASAKLANGCADLGWTVVSSASTMVVCEVPMSTMQSVLSALTMGNAYSTPPKSYLRFNVVGLGRGSRVQANGWMETQMAFGQVRTEQMTAAHYHNNVMNLFSGLGGEFPGGTTFPNHAFFGSGFEGTERDRGLRLVGIEPGSPAARAGLQEGDVLTRLAREKIKSANDLLDGLYRAAKTATYQVEVLRGGETVKATVEREYRPAAEGIDLASLPPTEVAPSSAVPALSVADELAKFAKLRDDGVISAEEFEAQKLKLLGS